MAASGQIEWQFIGVFRRSLRSADRNAPSDRSQNRKGRLTYGVWLCLPQPFPILIGNDKRVAFVVAQIADEGLVDDRIAAEVLAR